MRRTLKILPLVLIVLQSCEKLHIPENYPTTFSKLPSTTLSQARAAFKKANPYLRSSLNDFGFCGYYGDPLAAYMPPLRDTPVTQSEVFEIIKDFVSNNQKQTGICNKDELIFGRISTITGFGGAIGWAVKTENQKIDTIEILCSSVIFHLTNGIMTSCIGNWYPEICIPDKFNFNQSKAKTSLIGKTIGDYDIVGNVHYRTITRNYLEKTTIHLKVIPKEVNDNIELRVCWEIYIPDVWDIIYVDVMTGEIVGESPTMIS